jgi:acetyl-CoA C-acetyltransferase
MTRGFAEKYGPWALVRGEAPPEQRISTYGSRSLALTHNLGGYPGDMVSFVPIVGLS